MSHFDEVWWEIYVPQRDSARVKRTVVYQAVDAVFRTLNELFDNNASSARIIFRDRKRGFDTRRMIDSSYTAGAHIIGGLNDERIRKFRNCGAIVFHPCIDFDEAGRRYAAGGENRPHPQFIRRVQRNLVGNTGKPKILGNPGYGCGKV